MSDFRLTIGRGLVVVLGLVTALGCTGCVVVGHGSGGGWFVWPGGLGLVVVVLLVLFLLRRR